MLEDDMLGVNAPALLWFQIKLISYVSPINDCRSFDNIIKPNLLDIL